MYHKIEKWMKRIFLFYKYITLRGRLQDRIRVP